MYKKILSEPLRFPSDMSSDARDILKGLLTRDPNQRLGVNGAEEIKRHPFFAKHVDFKLLLQKKIQPPFKPSVVCIWVTAPSLFKCGFLNLMFYFLLVCLFPDL